MVANLFNSFYDFAVPAGTTTIQDEHGVVAADLNGTYRLPGHGYQANVNVADNYWRLQNNTYHNVTTFGVMLFILPWRNVATQHMLTLGDGSANAIANYGFTILINGTATVRTTLSSGSASNNVDAVAGSNIQRGQPMLIYMHYTRVGGTTDNLLKLRWTQDGVTWTENSITNARLMQQNSGFRLAAKPALSGTGGLNGTWMAFGIHNGSSLSNSVLEDIWNELYIPLPTANSIFTFNDAGPNAADHFGKFSWVPQPGTVYSYSGTGLQADSLPANHNFEASNTAYWDIEHYTIVGWIKPVTNSGTTRNWISNAKPSDAGTGGLKARSSINFSTGSVQHTIGTSTGSSNAIATDANYFDPTRAIFIVIQHIRITEGSNTGVIRCRWTHDGVTWVAAEGTTNPSVNDNTQVFKFKPLTSNSPAASQTGIEAIYQRIEIFDGWYLTDAQVQELFDRGAEAPAIPVIGSASFEAAGELTSGSASSVFAGVDLDAGAELSGEGNIAVYANSQLEAGGQLSISESSVVARGVAELIASGVLEGTGDIRTVGRTSLDGSGVLVGTPVVITPLHQIRHINKYIVPSKSIHIVE